MNRRNFLFGLSLGVLGLGAAAPAAQACDRYRRIRYFRGFDGPEIRRRELLRRRLFDIGERTEIALRNRRISRRDADDVFDHLDDVSDFLRNDRYLTNSEFDRRMDDLDEAEDELRDALGDRRFGRYRGRYRDPYYRY